MRGLRFMAAMAVVLSMGISSLFGVGVAAADDDDTTREQTLIYQVQNSKTKIKKISAKGRKISVSWNAVSLNGIRYQTAIKRYEDKKFTYRTTASEKASFSGCDRGRLYAFSVRPYLTVDGEKYYGKWAATKMVRIKLTITNKKMRSSYKKYRKRHGLTKGCFYYTDIDNNGTMEMLYRDRKRMGLFTVDKKTAKVKKLKMFNSGKGTVLPLYFDRSKHQIYFSCYRTGGGSGYLYHLSGKKIKRVRRFVYTNGAYEPRTYQINGAYVTKVFFDKEREKITRNFRRLVYHSK